jgi:altronate dehydratase large subunit
LIDGKNIPMTQTFAGYRRADGSIGVRNHVVVIPTVVCANSVVERLDREGTELALLTHQHGCAQVGDDLQMTRRVLSGVGRNPNVGATLLVSLGCETNVAEALAEDIGATGRPVELFRIQEYGGVSATLDAVRAAAARLSAELAAQEREQIPLSELSVGLECGGSDAWSGITANPALGRAADLLVEAGATVVLAETPETVGAEHLLAARATEPAVAERLLAAVATWELHAHATGADARGAQPTPGNQAGGLTTIEEKSLGALQKGGSTPLVEVVDYGERPTRRGLVFMDTPGQDIEQVTGFAAGGVHVVCFTTGRGTPTGCPVLPVVKISTNSRTASLLAEHIDIDAGPISTGDATIDSIGREIFETILAVAAGQRVAAEIGRHREFAIPRLWSSL